MRSFRLIGVALFVMFGFAAGLSAQTLIQPGQFAGASPIRIEVANLAAGTSSSALPLNSAMANVEDRHGQAVNRVWIASMLAAAGASSLDAATSWGKTEGNPLLASSNGTFGARGASLKIGIAAALIVPQILLRKHQELKKVFAIGNFGEAAFFSAVAVHNMGISAASSR